MSVILDLKPLVEEVAGVLVSVVMGFAVVAIRAANTWLTAKTGQQNLINEAAVKNNLHSALENAVDYAVAKIGSSNWTSLAIKSQLIAEGLTYVTQHVPDAVAYFKLDEASVESLLTAKLAQLDPALGTSAPAAASSTATTATAVVNEAPKVAT